MGLVGLELVAAEDGGDDEGEFHLRGDMLVFRYWLDRRVVYDGGMETYLCDVTSNAGARAVGERNEGASLSASLR